MIAEGIETLEKAKVLIKCGIEKVEDEAEIKELKRELSEVFFALYLGYTTQSEWDKAISANEQALKLNIDTLGEDDLNVSNNYYLGSQIYQKKLCFEEAMNHINKANEIIDTKTVKDPLLLCRYRFLRGKLLVNADQRENALKDLDEAIKVAQANPKLYNDEIEIKIFRTNAINSFSEEEIKRFGIDLEAEKAKTLADDAKREKIIKLQTAAAQSHAQSNGQPQPIGNAEKEEDEDEEETLFDGPAGVIAAVGGVVAVGAGIYYFMSKSN
jgi:tetratricopeptide (TPR) repeat protein